MASPLAQVTTLMPPVKGLNLASPAIALDAQEALVLENILPQQSSGELRGGWREWVTGIPGGIKSIVSFAAKLPKDNKVFACNDKGGIYDVTVTTDKPVSVAETAQANGEWDYTNTSGLEDNFLCMVSPSGGYWTYSVGDGFKKREITGAGAGKRFSAIFNFKARIWFIEEESCKIYYLGVGAIWGEAKVFDLSSVINEGGYIAYGSDWTYNAGRDINDYLVLVTTRGEVVVYSGVNPDDATTFALTGVWYVGPIPYGNQCFTQYGGELFIMCSMGVVPVSKLVNGGVANEYEVSSYKINPPLNAKFNQLKNKFGWAMDMIYDQQFLLLQMPVNNSNQYHFYVMNSGTGAWGAITGIPMVCATQVSGQVFFGTSDGRVCLGFTGDTDDRKLDGLAGKSIIGRYIGGFNAYGNAAYLKTFQLARPVFISGVAPSVGVEMLTKYPFSTISVQSEDPKVEGGSFNVNNFNECVWAGDSNTFSSWCGLNGMGYYGALAITFQGDAGTQYITTNVTLNVGGVM
jgi:hypothetical protein